VADSAPSSPTLAKKLIPDTPEGNYSNIQISKQLIQTKIIANSTNESPKNKEKAEEDKLTTPKVKKVFKFSKENGDADEVVKINSKHKVRISGKKKSTIQASESRNANDDLTNEHAKKQN